LKRGNRHATAERDPPDRKHHIRCDVALGISGAWAQDKTVQLKLSSWVPPAHPLNPSLKAWADDIEKETGGTVKATLFPSEQLGKAFDHYDMARDGIADFTYVNPGYQPAAFRSSRPVSCRPGRHAKGGSAALDAWYRKYAAQEMKDVHFCFAFVLDPGTWHGRKKIVLPEDIRGVKVRPSNAHHGCVRDAARRDQRASLGT